MSSILPFRSIRPIVGVATVLATVVALLPTALAPPASAAPVADNAALYAACGRVFPDPYAYWPSPSAAPGESPWAKGMFECRAQDFLGWDETLSGLDFLASDEMFPEFIEVYNLSGEDDGYENTVDSEFDDVLNQVEGEGMSAGLPTGDLGREQVPLYLIRVTDESSTDIAIGERKHFVYGLSIHGIERAGVEGGIRAAEDLATWAHCERYGDDESPANCALENAGPENPHPIMETIPEESTTAGDALRKSSVWFVLANPDGWRRGDKQQAAQDPGSEPTFFYQRYNGNGVDMNRDWPTRGFTFRPYTPWSEPETRSYGKALKSIKEDWTGGIDLHGQLIDRAFSFTLIGASERPYDKDRRVLQFTKGAWADAEQRLAWSSAIKPNDAPEDDPRVYGVQWGTIWDTIAYTVTGAWGDWMDSDLGLNAEGIDNEMSLSHLSNCGIGTCWVPEAEQLHVDGNKSLIYAQMHYSLVPEDTTFAYEGKAAYLFNPDRITNAGSSQTTAPEYTDLPQQEGFSTTFAHTPEETTSEPFEVKGPEQGFYNGGLRAKITWSNVSGVGMGSLNEVVLERKRSDEEDPPRTGEDSGDGDEWVVVNSYFNQSFIYLQGGAQLDANNPVPGLYRIRVTGDAPSLFQVDVEFLDEQAWPDPGQMAYDVSNMDFFEMLGEHVPSADKLTRVPVQDVLSGTVDLSWFDTVVAADNALLPDYVEPKPGTTAQEAIEETIACSCAPGAGERNEATSHYFEFDVNEAQGQLDAEVTSPTVTDPDLYLQIQFEDGTWSGDLASGTTFRAGLETLSYGNPAPGHYRLEIHNWAGSPGPANVKIGFTGREPVTNPSSYDGADRERMSALAREFAEQGGNLVLTDDSLRALEWMDITPGETVREQLVYAGNVQFSADGGETTTYDDPLAQNVNQPGAAEGDGHRHQVSEPVPTGYAIQDESGGDLNSHPQYMVRRDVYESAGGRVVGVLGAGGVTLGEIPLGDGVVRILGSLLPTPTEEFDHPFGIESYAITYSGYEVIRNLMDWTNPNGAAPGPQQPAPEPTEEPAAAPLPTTGGGPAPWALVVVVGALLIGVRLRRRLGTHWMLG